MWPSKLLGPAFIWMIKLEQFHGVWSMKSSLHRDVSCWTIKFLWVGWSQVIYLTPRHVHPGTSIFVCLALQKGWDLGSRIFGLILTFALLEFGIMQEQCSSNDYSVQIYHRLLRWAVSLEGFYLYKFRSKLVNIFITGSVGALLKKQNTVYTLPARWLSYITRKKGKRKMNSFRFNQKKMYSNMVSMII